MFGRNKEKSSADPAINEKKGKKGPEAEIDPVIADQIHIMPQRFYSAPKKSRAGLITIIILGILLLGGLSVVGYYFNEGLINQAANNNSSNQNVTVVNQNTNQEVNTNTMPVNVNENQNVNAGVNTSTSTDANTNQNTNTNTNTNVGTVTQLPSAADGDNDGLTAVEEQLYGTNEIVSDTDGDGYPDGSELLNGYDPTKANGALAASGLFKTFSGQGYSIIYPTNWKLNSLSSTEVIFQSDGGEFVEIITIMNSNRLSLFDWYKEELPGSNAESTVELKINSLDALRTADHLNYYLTMPSDTSLIYLVTYNVGNLSEANYMTTFGAMIKSFKLLR